MVILFAENIYCLRKSKLNHTIPTREILPCCVCDVHSAPSHTLTLWENYNELYILKVLVTKGGQNFDSLLIEIFFGIYFLQIEVFVLTIWLRIIQNIYSIIFEWWWKVNCQKLVWHVLIKLIIFACHFTNCQINNCFSSHDLCVLYLPIRVLVIC